MGAKAKGRVVDGDSDLLANPAPGRQGGDGRTAAPPPPHSEPPNALPHVPRVSRRLTTAFRETPNLRGGTTNRRPHGLMAMSTCNPPLCDTHGGGFKSTPPQRRICKQFTVTFGQLFFRPCPNACVSPRATPVPPISMLVLTPSQTGAGCWLAVILLGLLDRPPDRTPCRTANNSLRHGTKIPRVTG